MYLYVLVEDIKDNLKLFNNTHIFEPNILEKSFSILIGDGGHDLSKMYDSLLETPRTRRALAASSTSGSVRIQSLSA